MKITVATNKEEPWFQEWTFEFNKELVEKLRAIPGCRWVPERKLWLVPVEVAQLLREGKL